MKKVIFLAIICLLAISINTRASHVVGADISYVNIGNNEFRFTLKLFRDCAGIEVRNIYDITYQSLSCNVNKSFPVKMVRKEEVSPVCPSAPSNCLGGPNPGVEMYTFEGTVILPAQCSDWVFSWNKSDEFRNNAITNLNDPAYTGLYIEATLNNLIASTNNSPEFTNIPVSYLNLHQRNAINPGAKDNDGDSLVFSVISPMSNKATPVSYKSPFRASNPMSSSPGLTINASSGAMTINPTQEEISVTAILVEEYRNGQLIGSVVRDIQLIAEDYSNENPVISGINGTDSRSYQICAKDSACFFITASDPDGQNVNLTINSLNIPFSQYSFTVTGSSLNRQGNFCWPAPLPSVPGTYYFTITATDDNCPITGQSTETFELIVLPPPVVNLAPSVTISCNETYELDPNVSSGTAPYSYQWSTGETTPTVSKEAGVFEVLVTDAHGCQDSMTTVISSAIVARFSAITACENDTISFSDNSFTSNEEIIGWEWDFGNPASPFNTSNLKNPEHVYTEQGSYTINLTVEDDEGCRASASRTISICDRPIPDFTTNDSCKFKTLPIEDATQANCGIIYYQLEINGTVFKTENMSDIRHRFYPAYFPGSVAHGYFIHNYVPSDTGWYTVKQTVVNTNNCVDTISKRFYVYDNPYIDIAEPDSFFLCEQPEIVFHAIDMAGGTEPVRLFWNDLSTADSLITNEVGEYKVRIIDNYGCDTSATRFVKDPLQPMFHNSIFCNPDDHIQFTDFTESRWGIVSWEWYFGDGNTSTTQNPAHHYDIDSIYKVKLVVEDTSACRDSITFDVNQTLPTRQFSVTPLNHCFNKPISLVSPRGSTIDSLKWNFGNGDSITVGRCPTSSCGSMGYLNKDADNNYYYDPTYTYPKAGNTYEVSLQMLYNKYRSADTLLCRWDTAIDVRVYEEFKVQSEVAGFCAFGETEFNAVKTSGSDVDDQKWVIFHQEHDHGDGGGSHLHAVDSSTSSSFSTVFEEGGRYFAQYTSINSDGCEYDTLIPYSVIVMPKPEICPVNICATRQTQFFYFCGTFGEGLVDRAEWNFGDPASGSNNESTVENPFHIYDEDGYYDVYVKIFNDQYGCSEDTVENIRIYPLPEGEFTTSSPVCEGHAIFFTDQSTAITDDAIGTWTWIYGDGDTLMSNKSENTWHAYQAAGTYQAELYVENSVSGCTDTIVKEVTVHPNPVADFTYNENELIYERPIKFFDLSTGGIKWLWSFGDGDSVLIVDPMNKDPEHTYSGIFETTITQIVTNEFNCADTIIKKLDLKPYLLLPNAFSPNEDGANDGLKLHYKGIEELLEFKVYNRWGELIFDAGDNLNAVWDGTFKEVEQPVGAYVYHVKARTYTQEILAGSGKITLIR